MDGIEGNQRFHHRVLQGDEIHLEIDFGVSSVIFRVRCRFGLWLLLLLLWLIFFSHMKPFVDVCFSSCHVWFFVLSRFDFDRYLEAKFGENLLVVLQLGQLRIQRVLLHPNVICIQLLHHRLSAASCCVLRERTECVAPSGYSSSRHRGPMDERRNRILVLDTLPRTILSYSEN